MGLRLRCRDTQSPRRRFRWLELQWSHHRGEIYGQQGTGALLGVVNPPPLFRSSTEARTPQKRSSQNEGNVSQERTAAMRKLKAEVAERPGYNELSDPRAVETERERPRWNR